MEVELQTKVTANCFITKACCLLSYPIVQQWAGQNVDIEFFNAIYITYYEKIIYNSGI